jgi:hypothetical protein
VGADPIPLGLLSDLMNELPSRTEVQDTLTEPTAIFAEQKADERLARSSRQFQGHV